MLELAGLTLPRQRRVAQALTELALGAAVHQRGDAEAHKRLFGAYESELAAQRDDEREARRRAKKKRPAEG